MSKKKKLKKAVINFTHDNIALASTILNWLNEQDTIALNGLNTANTPNHELDELLLNVSGALHTKILEKKQYITTTLDKLHELQKSTASVDDENIDIYNQLDTFFSESTDELMEFSQLILVKISERLQACTFTPLKLTQAIYSVL